MCSCGRLPNLPPPEPSNKEAKMPEIIEIINKLKTFALFEGLGTRELHAARHHNKRADI